MAKQAHLKFIFGKVCMVLKHTAPIFYNNLIKLWFSTKQELYKTIAQQPVVYTKSF